MHSLYRNIPGRRKLLREEVRFLTKKRYLVGSFGGVSSLCLESPCGNLGEDEEAVLNLDP